MEVRLVAVSHDSGTEPYRVIVKTCNWGYGGALEAPRGLGPSPRSQPILLWKTLQNYAETDPDPAFIFSMCRTTAHSFRKYDNDGKIHYTDMLFMHLENTW